MSTQGDEQLNEMIRRLQALPERLTRSVLPELATQLREHIAGTIAAGTDAYGKTWKVRKQGGRALVNAAQHLYAAAVGDTIFARLTGIEARHHRGLVRGSSPRGDNARRILPIRDLPAPLIEQFRARLIEAFRSTVRGDE